MFYHAFDGYMDHAFPRDELKPLSCEGEDTLGGYALTLVRSVLNSVFTIIIKVNLHNTIYMQIDSLDTLALMGDLEHFTTSVEWIGKNLRFDIVSMQIQDINLHHLCKT